MAQIDITINGRIYKVTCADGQEAHVGRLGLYVDQKVGQLVKSIDQPVDVRMFLMASLMIADELAEARDELKLSGPAATATAPQSDPALVSAVDALAGRIQAIAAALEEDYL